MISQLQLFLEGKKGVFQIPCKEDQKMALSFHELPDFLVLKIFSFLRIRERLYLRRVSRKWNQLLYDFSIWKRINLNEEVFLSSNVNKQILKKWINDFGRTIHELDFSCTDWISDDDITEVASACVNLRGLGLKACSKISDQGISKIANNCLKLETINVFLSRVTSNGFEEIVRNCPNLSCVKLGSQGNTHSMLQSLCEYSLRITHLSIHDVVPYSASDPTVDDPLVMKIVLKFPKLERLNFTWCCFITDASLSALGKGCPNLRALKLRECQQISDHGLREILEKCVKLASLSLERLYKVTDLLVENDFRDCTKLSNIQSLRIFDTKVTDVGIARITEHCPGLSSLSFGEYSFHPKYIKGSCLSAVARNCKKLKSLNVFCEEVNNESLLILGECLKDLTDLSLGDCRRCTAAGVLEIAKNCQRLLRLSIKNCDSLGDEELSQIKKSLPYLKTFEFPGNTRITPFGSWFFISSSHNHLNLP